MMWFWRRVCSPECTDACHIYCPGCRNLADEWREQGHEIPEAASTASTVGRWRYFRHAVAWWSRSTLTALANPRRIIRGGPTPAEAAAGCGCEPAAVGEHGVNGGLPIVEAGLRPSATQPPDQVGAVPSYQVGDPASAQEDESQAMLACGNPLDHAGLQSGEVVLDLGTGAGTDALGAARQVGPDGHVFRLDKSDKTLALAHRNVVADGAENVAFLKGGADSVPLPRESVDAVVSNCTISPAPDRARALREAFRVLRPEGRLSLADIITREPVPQHLRGGLSTLSAGVGSAFSEEEYRTALAEAGFVDIEIERDQEFTPADAEAAGLTPLFAQAGVTEALGLGFADASVRARKPVPAAVGAESTARIPVGARPE